MKYPGRILTSALVLSISGCISQVDVQRLEVAASKKDASANPVVYYDLAKYPELIVYAQNLSNTYLDLSADASRLQDGAALLTIAAAATTAGGLLFGGGDDILKGAGLAAGTLIAGTSYLKPGETSAALLLASEQAHCIVRAAHTQTGASFETNLNMFNSAKTTSFTRLGVMNVNTLSSRLGLSLAASSLVGKADAAKTTRVDIIRDGLRTVRISLRKALKRDVPDYGSLIDSIKSAIIEQNKTEDESDAVPPVVVGPPGAPGIVAAARAIALLRQAIVEGAREAATAVDALRVEVNTCVTLA